ncbi:GNAT family N-acetyltransferase [Actinomycetospora flava]|uniref:Lysine N-acyltransferase MbtK n=1 Tax=Actinomycetospora flava TaxID=3129232 RepID=A0ABU8M1W7_9PSEU
MTDHDAAAGPPAEVGPPPLPVLASPWSLRLAGSDDVATVHAWMRRPHVARRWDQAWTRERWDAEIAGQLAGSHSRPCLVSRAGVDVAYVEIYRAVRDSLSDHYDAGRHDLGLHLAIGEEARTGDGLGSTLLALLAEGLFDADPGCRRVVLEPEHGNAPMHRALAKAGFSAVGAVDLPHKTALLHVRERAAG